MTTPLDVELVNDAAKLAQMAVIDFLKELVPLNLGSQGQTYGTKTMSREDRILAFIEDAQSGALDFLKTVNERFYKEYVAGFVRDVMHSPVMRSNPGVVKFADYAQSMIEEAA